MAHSEPESGNDGFLKHDQKILELQAKVATLQSERVLIVNYINQLKGLLDINNTFNIESNIKLDLEQIIEKTKEFLVQNSRISEELSNKRNDLKQIFDLCSMAKINQSSSRKTYVHSDSSAKVKTERPLDISSSPQQAKEKNSNYKEDLAITDCSEKQTKWYGIMCEEPTPLEASETLVSETIPNVNNGECPGETIKKNDDLQPSHGNVPIDPLYSDPRRPDARVFACKCGKQYLSSSAFRLHVVTTKFGAAYKCKICMKDFCYFKSLQKHLMNIHKKELGVFLCSFCDLEFQSHGVFTKHLLNIHDD